MKTFKNYIALSFLLLIFTDVSYASDLVAEAGTNQHVQVNQEVYFDGSKSSGNIISYLWDFGDGSTGSGTTPSHTYIEEGTYTVSLTVINAESGISTDTLTITVEGVQPVTTIDLSNGGIFYGGDNSLIEVYIDNNDKNNYQYQFSINGVVIQSWSNLSSLYWQPDNEAYGVYTLEIEVISNITGRYKLETKKIFIYRKPIGPPPHV